MTRLDRIVEIYATAFSAIPSEDGLPLTPDDHIRMASLALDAEPDWGVIAHGEDRLEPKDVPAALAPLVEAMLDAGVSEDDTSEYVSLLIFEAAAGFAGGPRTVRDDMNEDAETGGPDRPGS